MPYHDLNILHTANAVQLNHTLAFAKELGYKTIAISSVIHGKIPSGLSAPDLSQQRNTHPDLKLLTRLTLTVNDTSQNHRLATLQPIYDILALRPLNEKSLQLCCGTLDCELISLDLSARLPFILKFKTVASAIHRGIRFEICYSPITDSSESKRNLIAGAATLIRATRGRGIILSSEARNALGLRGPHDVMNLAQIWGLEQAKGKEGLVEEADKVVRLAALRRNSYRGVITVVNGGTPNQATIMAAKEVNAATDAAETSTPLLSGLADKQATSTNGIKRKASTNSLNNANAESSTAAFSTPTTSTPGASTPTDDPDKPISKREQKRRAKKAKLEARGPPQDNNQVASKASKFPLKHETLASPQKKKPGQQKKPAVSRDGRPITKTPSSDMLNYD